MQLDPEYWITQRKHSDSFADACIESLLLDKSYESARDVMSRFMGSNVELPPNAPAALVAYMDTAMALPDWYDEERVLRAQEIYVEFGIESAVILLCKSLPQCYSLAHGAQVLHATGRLVNHQNAVQEPFVYRIMETLQFIANVTTYGSFQPSGDAITTVRRIRLIHAAIRTFLGHSHHWNSEKLGAPINQEDLVLTLTTFSVSIIDGWRDLGVSLSNADRDCCVHLWAVVGYVLGIHVDNIPHTYEDSIAVQQFILKQQAKFSHSGAELTDSVRKFVSFISGNWIHPKITIEVMHVFIGKEISKCVGVPSDDDSLDFTARVLRFFIRIIVSLQQRYRWFGNVVRNFTGWLFQRIIGRFSGQTEILFPLPKGLRD